MVSFGKTEICIGKMVTFGSVLDQSSTISMTCEPLLLPCGGVPTGNGVGATTEAEHRRLVRSFTLRFHHFETASDRSSKMASPTAPLPEAEAFTGNALKGNMPLTRGIFHKCDFKHRC